MEEELLKVVYNHLKSLNIKQISFHEDKFSLDYTFENNSYNVTIKKDERTRRTTKTKQRRFS